MIYLIIPNVRLEIFQGVTSVIGRSSVLNIHCNDVIRYTLGYVTERSVRGVGSTATTTRTTRTWCLPVCRRDALASGRTPACSCGLGSAADDDDRGTYVKFDMQ